MFNICVRVFFFNLFLCNAKLAFDLTESHLLEM